MEPFEIKVEEGQLIDVKSERGGTIESGSVIGELIRLRMSDLALGGVDLENSRRE